MKFFIDTANLTEIKDLIKTGMIDGVTTNPSLIAKEGAVFQSRIYDICQLVPDKPVSAEVTALEADGMIAQGKELAAIAKNVCIKIPLTWEGLKATKTLSQDGHMVNVTLCFSTNQALLAAKAGASFISPFVGRLDDIGDDGMKLIADIRQIYDNYNFNTEILVASIRSPEHVHQSALIGADVATIPAKVLHTLINHPLTDKGLDTFMADWDKYAKGK